MTEKITPIEIFLSAAGDQADQAQPQPKIAIQAEATASFNLAMQQNFVPVMGNLRVINHGDQPVSGLTLTITSDPAFFAAFTCEINSIADGSTFAINEPDLKVSAEYLLALKERIITTIQAKVAVGGHTFTCENRINLLAFNECDGYIHLPELISAYILPNSQVVEQLLARSSDHLKNWGHSAAISGYQTRDPGVARNIAGAIFAAIASCRINYCVPPASFEAGGQKIRFPEIIMGNGLATCLDLSLLCCACLEQAGLNPLIVLTANHAFVGVWLKDESFPLCFIDNALPLRKRVELKEIVVFESTIVTHENSDFTSAMQVGEQKLLQDDIIGFIDIRRCRSTHILPLPVIFDGHNFTIRPPEKYISESSAARKPDELQQPAFASSQPEDKPAGNRIDQWKRKLLDLSLRNKLLNHRETAKTIKISCSSLARLEDCLADGKEYRIRPLPADIEAGRSNQAHLAGTGSEILTEFIQREFEQHRLYSAISGAALEKSLLEVYRDARNSLEEGGTNTLYLAMGFLYWQESKNSEQLRAAPIVLVPLEISRSSVKEGFTICRRDEEPQINVTLLEMLKLDFNLDIQGLDPLPLDNHGVDLDKTLNTVRRHVLELENWEVREEAVIGNFQFRKFLMYKDLELRSGMLLENKVVNHLVLGNEGSFPDQGEFPDTRRIDQDYALDQTYCPLSADGSQMAAVYAAASGRSFVLHGPPGTGKSQTITNIIAHSIASGKSVLFVSEKAAALNVVYNRLSKIGLGPYCLELHSNKSRKAEVLEQLKKALTSRQQCDVNSWQKIAGNIQDLRAELNDYVKVLHQQQPNGQSFYQALSALADLTDVSEKTLNWSIFSNFTAEDLQTTRNCLKQIALLGKDCGKISASPWQLARTADWSPEINRSTAELLNSTRDTGKSLLVHCSTISESLRIKNFANSLNGLSSMTELLRSLINGPAGALPMLEAQDWAVTRRALTRICEIGQSRDIERFQLLQRFKDSILQLEVEEFRQNWENAGASIWPLSWLRKRAVLSSLNQHCLAGQSIGETDILQVFNLVKSCQTAQISLQTADEQAFKFFTTGWNDGEADWNKLSTLINWVDSTLDTANALCAQIGEDLTGTKKIITAIYNRLQTKSADTECQTMTSLFVNCASAFLQNYQKLKLCLELTSMPVARSDAESTAFVKSVINHVTQWQAAFSGFKSWCQLNAAINKAGQMGLTNLMNELRAGDINFEELWPVFQKSYLSAWAESQSSAVPLLRNFSGTLHNDSIEKFRQLDEKFLELTGQAVVAKVAGRMPAGNGAVAANSELGILNREIQKKARHKPLRVLFAEISRLLPRLKPCLLMSPISVAQYLAPDHPPFDLVIFDEASQVPVWDAIGAIARGKDLIVVGDPKQLPPTSFFSRSESQEWEESELTEDLESILDDCIASGLPDMHLNWHYRSLHESLITFSNSCYYDNRLYTFPAARFSGLGVKYHFLANAPYDKGRSRTNPGEARAVVAEVLRRLRDPKLAGFSIGVVTFSVAQQTLVEDQLDDARRRDPSLEEFFSDKCAEPVFVKNLESVQGDERDVIIFSICYGPDTEGRVSMNFGPLNKVGGERRLNVAITRARRELLVITTLKPDMISLSRTRAVGVKHLKMFLDFAERGVKAITEATSHTGTSDYQSPFEKAVGEALKKSGFEIHTQVGCSGYRIDLAIVHPDFPGRYLLGVECDGASYHSANSARERDKLRHAVLTQLGWNLHRIWSSDWWHNPTAEIDKIRQKVEQCLSLKGIEGDDADKISIIASESENNITESEAANDTVAGIAEDLPSQLSENSAVATSYRVWSGDGRIFPAASFDYVSSNAILRKMIEEITSIEGPVSLPHLSRRICAQFGIIRVTQRIMMRIQQLAVNSKVHVDRRHQQIFFWESDSEIAGFVTYRRHTPENKRKPEDLCPDEVANAAYAVLQANISMEEEDLLKHTAQCFGFRLGQNVAEAMQAGIKYLHQTRPIEIANGRISLN